MCFEATPVVDKAIERALAAQPGSAISLGVTVVPGGISSFVSTLAKRFDRAAVDSKLYLRNLRPWLSKEAAGRKLTQRQAVRDIGTALASGTRTGLQVGVTRRSVRRSRARTSAR